MKKINATKTVLRVNHGLYLLRVNTDKRVEFLAFEFKISQYERKKNKKQYFMYIIHKVGYRNYDIIFAYICIRSLHATVSRVAPSNLNTSHGRVGQSVIMNFS